MTTYPSVIFGTHKLQKESILYALRNGLLMLDTATGYNNAELIGDVLKEFDSNANIVTKFNSNDFEQNIYDIS
jgi:diketogulonate reductase-like aldo/keto reductase